jgi:hypothetical protein
VKALEDALAALGRPHMIIGGIAVIARGVPRQTDDVDATVAAEGLDLDQLVDALRQHGIEGRIADLVPFARERQVLLLRHVASGVPIELTLAWIPFELEAMSRAERVRIGDANPPVALADDLVVYKAIAWRDRDRADIERLLVLHGPRLDLGRIRSLVAQLSEAIDEPERLRELDDLVRKAAPAPV